MAPRLKMPTGQRTFPVAWGIPVPEHRHNFIFRVFPVLKMKSASEQKYPAKQPDPYVYQYSAICRPHPPEVAVPDETGR